MHFARNSDSRSEVIRSRCSCHRTCNNLVNHAKDGELLLSTLEQFDMLSIDNGPGMNVDACFATVSQPREPPAQVLARFGGLRPSSRVSRHERDIPGCRLWSVLRQLGVARAPINGETRVGIPGA